MPEPKDSIRCAVYGGTGDCFLWMMEARYFPTKKRWCWYSYDVFADANSPRIYLSEVDLRGHFTSGLPAVRLAELKQLPKTRAVKVLAMQVALTGGGE